MVFKCNIRLYSLEACIIALQYIDLYHSSVSITQWIYIDRQCLRILQAQPQMFSVNKLGGSAWKFKTQYILSESKIYNLFNSNEGNPMLQIHQREFVK